MDTRRVGHAQRRRAGAPSNVYADTMKPPSFGVGDQVKAKGRYGTQMVSNVISKAVRPDAAANVDGHAYEVTGGKGGRRSMHFSSELNPSTPSGACGYCGGVGMAPNGAACPSCGGSGHSGG